MQFNNSFKAFKQYSHLSLSMFLCHLFTSTVTNSFSYNVSIINVVLPFSQDSITIIERREFTGLEPHTIIQAPVPSQEKARPQPNGLN